MKAIIDRMEGQLAVLLLADYEDLSINIPREYLPAEAKAGDHLNATFTLDIESCTKTATHVQELLKDLTKDNDDNQQNFQL